MNDTNDTDDESLQSSPLAQRLQRRMVESPGVINVRHLPTHYTQSTVSRIIQRQNLPEQVSSRYGNTGIVQQNQFAHFWERSRVEVGSNSDTPLATSVVQRSVSTPSPSEPWLGMQSTSRVQEQSFSPLPQSSSGTYRVVQRLGSDISSSSSNTVVQRLGSDISSSGSANVQVSGGDTNYTAPPVNTVSVVERVRVQHPRRGDEVISRVSMPLSTNQNLGIDEETNHIDTHRIGREGNQEEEEGESRGMDGTSTPVTMVHRLPEVSSVTKYSLNGGMDTKSESVKVVHRLPQNSSAVIAMTKSSQGSAMSPVVVARMPLSDVQSQKIVQLSSVQKLSAPSQPLLVQRQSNDDFSGVAESVTTVQPVMEIVNSKLALPLNMAQGGVIHRQENTNSVTVESVTPATASSPTPATAPANSPGEAIDIQQIATQVSRILNRQIAVERERRGIGKWY